MKTTNTDTMLIKMITPRLIQIEMKFIHGEELTPKDINTLLLKNQYNHICYLNKKLDKIQTDIASLKINPTIFQHNIEYKFGNLEQKFESLEQKFESLEQKINTSVQRALNKNVYYFLGVGIIFLLISKLIDKTFI